MSITYDPMITTSRSVSWQSNLADLTQVMSVFSLQRVERFVSVGTPAERNLGAAIVDAFADDLRRLADA